MSVHGYPADKSIFYCNLKFGLLKSQKETAGSVSRQMQTQKKTILCLLLASPSLLRVRRFWAIIHVVSSWVACFKSASIPWMQFLPQFK